MGSFMLSAILASILSVGADPSPVGSGFKPATMSVTLPADAKLFIDGMPTRSTSARRWFISPPLDPGKSYGYAIKVEFMRDGKTVTVERDVTVKGGRDTPVSFFDSQETRAFYYTPDRTPVIDTDWTYTPGLQIPFYGPDPSSPFYVSYGW